MAGVIIYSPYPQLDGEDIWPVERQLGVVLPDSYRSFLLSHNGGSPQPNIFPINGSRADTHGTLHQFYCIQDGEYLDLRRQANVFRDRIPPDLLPIAHDPGGNLICLGITGPSQGKIYFWDHEEEVEEGEVPGYDNVYFIADSLRDLVDSLTYLLE